MIAPEQMVYVGFESEECEAVCRPCAIKRWGELTVNRVLTGLEQPPNGWRPLMLYNAIEDAIENGYNMAYGHRSPCGVPDCPREQRAEDEWYCGRCAECLCIDCGVDLAAEKEAA